MLDIHLPLFIMGGLILIIALSIGKITHWMKITSVVGYLACGIILGPEGLELIEFNRYEIEHITWFALGFIGFTIGSKLPISLIKKSGKNLLFILAGDVFIPFLLVFTGIYLLKGSLSLGLIFGGLACSTAPAGTIAVIYEYKARGSLTDAIMAIVGLDDALGVIVFGISLAIASTVLGDGGDSSIWVTMLEPLKEIVSAIILGIILGGILSFLVRRIHSKVDILVIFMGLLILNIGIEMLLDFSVIISCMTMGFVFINTCPLGNRVLLRDLDKLTLPVIIVFFVTAGLELKFSALFTIGGLMVAVVYILFRSAGKLAGPMLGARVGKADGKIQQYIGFGLLPQAGVALGLALMASHTLMEIGYPDMAATIITTITATTVVFEIIGPIGARFALIKSGEAVNK